MPKLFFAQVSLLVKPMKEPIPYYIDSLQNDTDIVTIINSNPFPITTQIQIEIYRGLILVAKTDSSNLSFLMVNPMSNHVLQAIEYDTSLEFPPFIIFEETIFKNRLSENNITLDPAYNSRIRLKWKNSTDPLSPFNYTTWTSLVMTNVSIPPINVIFPLNNDTISNRVEAIRLMWDAYHNTVSDNNLYRLQLWEDLNYSEVFGSGQQLVIDTIISENSFIWNTAKKNPPIVWDTNYVDKHKFKWVVKNVLPTPYNIPQYDNSSSFHYFFITERPIPYLDSLSDTAQIIYDAFFNYGYSEELILSSRRPPDDPGTVYNIPRSWPDMTNYLVCANGDGEMNNFTNWKGGIGTHTTQVFTIDQNGIFNTDPDRDKRQHEIMNNTDIDQITNGALSVVSPLGGDHSIRLGDVFEYGQNGPTGSIAALKYKFTVNNENKHFKFLYALVLDEGHFDGSGAFFQYTINDLTNSEVIQKEFYTIPSDNPEDYHPLFRKVPNRFTYYKNWSCAYADLTSRLNHEIEVEFISGDCNSTAHHGYAYIDGLCDNNIEPIPSFTIDETFCIDDDIIPNGTGSSYKSNHFWSVQESNSSWGAIGEEKSEWFLDKEADWFDIKAFYESKGGTWKCVTYYRIILAVQSACGTWFDETKLIYIEPCQLADMDPNVFKCNSNRVYIGVTPYICAFTYSWDKTLYTASTGGSTSTSNSNGWVAPTITTSYTLSITSTNGCISKNTITVNVLSAPTSGLYYSMSCSPDPCNVTLYTSPPNKFEEVIWTISGNNYTGTPYTHSGFSEPTYVSAYISNPCGSTLKSITIPPNNFYGTLKEIVRPNSVNIGSSNPVVNQFYIWDKEFGNSFSGYPAYNINYYKLRILTSWGAIEENLNSSCTGFNNGDIMWDCKFKGEIVPDDTYDYQLYWKNCSNTDHRTYLEYETYYNFAGGFVNTLTFGFWKPKGNFWMGKSIAKSNFSVHIFH